MRDVVDPGQRYPKLRVHVSHGGDDEHVVAPVIGVVHAKRHGRGERDEQEILERSHVLPRELVQGAGLERHGDRSDQSATSPGDLG